MTSLDQEEIRRTQAERRMAMAQTNDGESGKWFLGIVVLIAIIGGILLMGSGGGDGTAATTAPVAEETTPAATGTD